MIFFIVVYDDPGGKLSHSSERALRVLITGHTMICCSVVRMESWLLFQLLIFRGINTVDKKQPFLFVAPAAVVNILNSNCCYRPPCSDSAYLCQELKKEEQLPQGGPYLPTTSSFRMSLPVSAGDVIESGPERVKTSANGHQFYFRQRFGSFEWRKLAGIGLDDIIRGVNLEALQVR